MSKWPWQHDASLPHDEHDHALEAHIQALYEASVRRIQGFTTDFLGIVGWSSHAAEQRMRLVEAMATSNVEELDRLGALPHLSDQRRAMRGELRAELAGAEALRASIVALLQRHFKPDFQPSPGPITLPILWRTRVCLGHLRTTNATLAATATAMLVEIQQGRQHGGRFNVSVHPPEITALSRSESSLAQLITLCKGLQRLADAHAPAGDDDKE
jgi:hypothetical protein